MKKICLSLISLLGLVLVISIISAASGADMGTKSISINGVASDVKLTFDSEVSVLVRLDNFQRALILQRDTNNYQFRDGQTKVGDMYFIITQIVYEVRPEFKTSAETMAFFKKDLIEGDNLDLVFDGNSYNVEIDSIIEDSVKLSIGGKEKTLSLQNDQPYDFELMDGLYLIVAKISSLDNSSVATLYIGHDMVFGRDDVTVAEEDGVGDDEDSDGDDVADEDSDGDDDVDDEDSNGDDDVDDGMADEGELEISIKQAEDLARNQLGVDNCNEALECKTVLKDIGENDEENYVYEIQIEKKSRFLGIFKKMMKIRVIVNANTGDVETNKPWWAFLASE